MTFKKYLAILTIVVLSLSSFVNSSFALSNTANNTYTKIEAQIDSAFKKIDKKISSKSTDNQIKIYEQIISRIDNIRVKNKNLNEQSEFILDHIESKCDEVIADLGWDQISVSDIFNNLVDDEDEKPVVTPIYVHKAPVITPGSIDSDDRWASEIWEFNVSLGTISLYELELELTADEEFDIKKGKVYILNNRLQVVANNSGYTYDDEAATVTYKNQNIKLTPGKYTIWVESIEVEDYTEMEIEIRDLNAEGKFEDEIEDKYIWKVISEVEIDAAEEEDNDEVEETIFWDISNAKVVALWAYEWGYSAWEWHGWEIWSDGTHTHNRDTGYIDINIDDEWWDQDIILVLSTYEPVVWSISWDTDRIKWVILSWYHISTIEWLSNNIHVEKMSLKWEASNDYFYTYEKWKWKYQKMEDAVDDLIDRDIDYFGWKYKVGNFDIEAGKYDIEIDVD